MATDFNLVTDAAKFDINGSYLVTTQDGAPAIRFAVGLGFEDTLKNHFPIEFVADCTQLELRGYFYQNCFLSTDGGAFQTITQDGLSGYHVLKTGLAAGKHLFRMFASDGFWNGFRLTGGAETIDTVATTKVIGTGSPQPSRTMSGATPVKLWGARKLNGAEGTSTLSPYGGQIVEFAFTGTDVEVAGIATNSTAACVVSIDGAAEVVVSGGDSSNNASNAMLRLNPTGLTPGSHTIRVTYAGGGKDIKAFRVLNASRLSSSSAVSATTITVDDGTKYAVGQWVRIDVYSKMEYRQITAIASNVLTVAALSQAHAQYVSVVGWHHSAGTISAWNTDRSAKRFGAIGDSNTQGANPYGLAAETPPDGLTYYAYDSRISYITKLANLLTVEPVNLGISGQTTVNWVTSKADIGTYAGTGYDAFFIWPATNDVNSNTTTPSEFEANVRQLVVAAIAALKTGGKVYLFGSKTPSSTSAKGLNSSVIDGILTTIASDTATYGTAVQNVTSIAYAGVNLTVYNVSTNPTGDIDGSLHYRPSAHVKIAANFAAMLSATTGISTIGFGIGAGMRCAS